MENLKTRADEVYKLYFVDDLLVGLQRQKSFCFRGQGMTRQSMQLLQLLQP